MPNAPQLRRSRSAAQQLFAGDDGNIIILGEAVDGFSLNGDNKLIDIGNLADLAKLGTNLNSSPLFETLQSQIEIGEAKFKFGRIVGTGGAKAQTAIINDFAGVPAPTIRFQWTLGTEGNLYRIVVARGKNSTTDTGAGRVDTKISLTEIATGKVVKFLDGLVMDASSNNYAVTQWNLLGTNATATDLTPADTYQNTDEPAVGNYDFTGGTAPAAATATEYLAAVNALAAKPETTLSRIGIWGWASTDVNVLAGQAFAKLWAIVDVLTDGATAATAKARHAAITNFPEAVATFAGWGIWYKNPKKRIPGLGVALGMAVKAGREIGINHVGANLPVAGFNSFDPPAELDGFADAYCNPIYMLPEGEGRVGVVVMDVQSHNTSDPRYAQWGMWWAECNIVRDIQNYLKRTILNPEYPYGRKNASGVNADISLSTFEAIRLAVSSYMSQIPVGVLDSRDEGEGWSWGSDGSNTATGFKPKYTLGLIVAGVAREIEFEVGEVAGQVNVNVAGGN